MNSLNMKPLQPCLAKNVMLILLNGYSTVTNVKMKSISNTGETVHTIIIKKYWHTTQKKFLQEIFSMKYYFSYMMHWKISKSWMCSYGEISVLYYDDDMVHEYVKQVYIHVYLINFIIHYFFLSFSITSNEKYRLQFTMDWKL